MGRTRAARAPGPLPPAGEREPVPLSPTPHARLGSGDELASPRRSHGPLHRPGERGLAAAFPAPGATGRLRPVSSMELEAHGLKTARGTPASRLRIHSVFTSAIFFLSR